MYVATAALSFGPVTMTEQLCSLFCFVSNEEKLWEDKKETERERRHTLRATIRYGEYIAEQCGAFGCAATAQK